MNAFSNGAAAAPAGSSLSAQEINQGMALHVSNLGVRLPRGRGISRLWGQHHWAFRGVDFELKRGESIGILGRNGSGKSTLLRAIAGIISVDEGMIAMAPDLTAAILSPGAGFENNLTGRENLYNSALYQGFLPKVVSAKINDIVELSGIGEWIDQPVAIYSAGMRARLGLSLALHLPSDVLMIDETLSAGDAAFRASAKKMIDQLIASNRTVLLVSHNLDTLRTMCTKGIVLDQGRQVAACGIDEAIEISKSLLLGPGLSKPDAREPTQHEQIRAQIKEVEDQLAEWRQRLAEHSSALRIVNHGYQAALERTIQIADQMVAQQQTAAAISETTSLRGDGDFAPDVEKVIRSYRDACEKAQARRAERDEVRAEQERITKIGDDLRGRMSALREELSRLGPVPPAER